MQSVKILHCADIHIGASESFLNERSRDRRLETLMTFESIIAKAAECGVQIILIAGDLFDSNNIEHSFAERVFSAISSVPEIKVVFAAGNHDPLSADSPFKRGLLPKNLYVLPCRDSYFEFEDLKVRVYGSSFEEVYKRGKERFTFKGEEEFINLMCIHGDFGSDAGSNYNAVSETFISESGMDYIALGHVHRRSEIVTVKNTSFSYCGCPEGQGFDELGEKGVYIGEISKGAVHLNFVPICRRMHLCEKIDISNARNSLEASDIIIDFLKSKYGASFSKNLYKIVLCGETESGISLDFREMLGRLNSQVYYAKIQDKTELGKDLQAISHENSLKGIFVKKMLEKISAGEDADRYKYALKIGLRAFDPEVEVYEDQ